MKKIYQAPAITVVNVKPQLMGTSDFNKSLGDSSTGGSGRNALGRGSSGWDDDDE